MLQGGQASFLVTLVTSFFGHFRSFLVPFSWFGVIWGQFWSFLGTKKISPNLLGHPVDLIAFGAVLCMAWTVSLDETIDSVAAFQGWVFLMEDKLAAERKRGGESPLGHWLYKQSWTHTSRLDGKWDYNDSLVEVKDYYGQIQGLHWWLSTVFLYCIQW